MVAPRRFRADHRNGDRSRAKSGQSYTEWTSSSSKLCRPRRAAISNAILGRLTGPLRTRSNCSAASLEEYADRQLADDHRRIARGYSVHRAAEATFGHRAAPRVEICSTPIRSQSVHPPGADKPTAEMNRKTARSFQVFCPGGPARCARRSCGHLRDITERKRPKNKSRTSRAD